MKLTKLHLIFGITLWWTLFLWLRAIPSLPQPLINTLGFSFLMLVPGGLTVANLGLKKLAPWTKLAVAVGFSVLELMIVGLVSNTVLQCAGVARPLDPRFIIIDVGLLVAALLSPMLRPSLDWEVDLGQLGRTLFPRRRDLVFALVPLAFIALAVLGATSLNNGGPDGWTMIMLVGAAVYAGFLLLKSHSLTDTSIVTGLFLTGLALLLMTSLRGWYVTGHDIQREYRVFELAKSAGVWKIQSYRDAYNACLSITILPTMLANLLKSLDPYIYKIYFQIIFALCPPIVYLLMRRFAAKFLALLAAVYFMAFPTFFNDMPFLNRQEIAFIFFGLMLLIVFQDHLKLRLRQALFLIMGVGVVLSHYSTTYSVIAILLVMLVSRSLIPRLAKPVAGRGWFQRSTFLALAKPKADQVKRLSIALLVALAVGSFLWNSVITNTGTSVLAIAKQTLVDTLASFKEDVPKSSDTNAGLFTWAKLNSEQQLDQYIKDSVTPTRLADPLVYFPTATYSQYPVSAAAADIAPLTKLGSWLSHRRIDVSGAIFAFRQGTAKLLQILMLIGFIYFLVRRGLVAKLDTDVLALMVGAVVFVALQVVLPLLSVEYGLFRAFQQSLVLLGLPIAAGSLVLFARLPWPRWRQIAPVMLVLVFFLSSTGFIPQLLGGYDPQLALANSGTYYDVYYTTKPELSALNWLAQTVNQTFNPSQQEIQTDQFNLLSQGSFSSVGVLNSVYPGAVRQDAYVYLGQAAVSRSQVTLAYNGNLIFYTYPIDFLHANKNLIYSNDGARIYR